VVNEAWAPKEAECFKQVLGTIKWAVFPIKRVLGLKHRLKASAARRSIFDTCAMHVKNVAFAFLTGITCLRKNNIYNKRRKSVTSSAGFPTRRRARNARACIHTYIDACLGRTRYQT
jgi:hypothetical protein